MFILVRLGTLKLLHSRYELTVKLHCNHLVMIN